MRPEVTIKSGEPAGIPGPTEAERLYLDIDGVDHIALLSRDAVSNIGGKDVYRWHISLSIEEESAAMSSEVPLWRNLVAVAHKLRPGVVFSVPVPPENQWYNLNPAVLHVYEIDDPALVDHFRIQHDAARKLEKLRPGVHGLTEPS